MTKLGKSYFSPKIGRLIVNINKQNNTTTTRKETQYYNHKILLKKKGNVSSRGTGRTVTPAHASREMVRNHAARNSSPLSLSATHLLLPSPSLASSAIAPGSSEHSSLHTPQLHLLHGGAAPMRHGLRAQGQGGHGLRARGGLRLGLQQAAMDCIGAPRRRCWDRAGGTMPSRADEPPWMTTMKVASPTSGQRCWSHHFVLLQLAKSKAGTSIVFCCNQQASWKHN